MTHDPDGFPLDPDPLHPGDWFLDPRVPSMSSPWEHQREAAFERHRRAARRLGCAIVLMAVAFGVLLITIVVAFFAGPR